MIPGSGEAGPAAVEHAFESDWAPSDSSKVISMSPPWRYAAEAMIFGTQVGRNVSMSASADVPPVWFLHGKSCPSSQRFGVMNE